MHCHRDLSQDPFILHRNCAAVPIYRLLSAASHRSITAYQVKMNLTFMQHRNAVTSQFLCSWAQCGNATQLRCSINGPLVLASHFQPTHVKPNKSLSRYSWEKKNWSTIHSSYRALFPSILFYRGIIEEMLLKQ